MIRVGTAGWGIPRQFAGEFPATDAGSGLQRYAGRFDAVEVNSTFHRLHKPETFARWAAAVADDFRFAVKLPKAITHEKRLVDSTEMLQVFLQAIRPLEPRLGPLLIQLPSSFAFHAELALGFLGALRERFTDFVALEPRHPSWFEAEADALLVDHQVARAAADPARIPAAAVPGGWRRLAYYRLHGSPHMYCSDYDAGFLDALGERLAGSCDGQCPNDARALWLEPPG